MRYKRNIEMINTIRIRYIKQIKIINPQQIPPEIAALIN